MQDTDQEMQGLRAQIAELLGKPVEEVAAMTPEQMTDATTRLSFLNLGVFTAHRHDTTEGVHLMEDGIEGQADRVVAALERLHGRVPLWPVATEGVTADLFGFGRAPVQFVTQEPDQDGRQVRYFLLSELAEPLGIPLHKAHAWAEWEAVDALRAQRERDEEAGALGWDCLNDVVDLGIYLTVDDPEAAPDASGKRWSIAGEWLVSDRRLLALMTASPWSHVFYENARPLMAHAFINSGMADLLGGVPTYMTVETYDGETKTGPTGDTLGDHIREDAARMPVEEAAERAMRGLGLSEG
jgi:hypothetical protein